MPATMPASSRSSSSPSAATKQLLRVLAIAFLLSLGNILGIAKIDWVGSSSSSGGGGYADFINWMLSPAAATTTRLVPEDPNYVHASYLDNNDVHVAQLQSMELSLEKKLSASRDDGGGGIRIRSCRRRGTRGIDSGNTTGYHVDGLASCRHVLQEHNQGTNSTLLIYNPHDQPRIICGETVAADDVLRVATNMPDLQQKLKLIKCLQRNEPSRLHEHIPDPENAMQLPPIRMRNTPGGSDNTNFVQFDDGCDMNCQEEKGRIGLIAQRYVDGTDWKFQFSMEGGVYYPNIVIQPQAYRDNQFYSTTSFRSEVPAAYFSWDEYNIQAPPVNYSDAIKGASFLARNCASRNNRENLVREIMGWRGENNASFRVDALSKCLHNAEPQKGWDLRNKVDIMKRYLFHLSLENSIEDDYITEKLWGALESGSIPVYYGAPNAKDHAPPNSIILANDFRNGGELAAHLDRVAMNKTHYESYHEWRNTPLEETFVRKYNHTHTHSVCRRCRWSYARRHGLGFDHESQTVQSTKADRKVSLDADGWASGPVAEKWQDGDSVSWTAASKDCFNKNITNANRSKRIGSGQLKRTVWEHDGVIDLHVDPVAFVPQDATFSLGLLLPDAVGGDWDIRGPVGRSLHREQAWIQTNESRVTVFTRPKVQSVLAYPKSAAIPAPARIVLIIPSKTLPLRIRIVVDDIDNFHEGAEKDETYFAKQMEKDFYQPLEFFHLH